MQLLILNSALFPRYYMDYSAFEICSQTIIQSILRMFWSCSANFKIRETWEIQEQCCNNLIRCLAWEPALCTQSVPCHRGSRMSALGRKDLQFLLASYHSKGFSLSLLRYGYFIFVLQSDNPCSGKRRSCFPAPLEKINLLTFNSLNNFFFQGTPVRGQALF